MESYGHMAVGYGDKYCFDFGVTNKFYWQIFLSILYSEDQLFLTNVIVCVSFEKIYFEQISPRPVLEWHSTIFLTFQHHLKISGTIFMAHIVICGYFFHTFGHFLIAKCLFSDSTLR